MVVFVCDKCNETLKKKSVERHFHACRSSHVSCVDCSKTFTPQDFAFHTSCISEQEKYDKPNFHESAPKGAQKQMSWTTFVHSRLSGFKTSPGVPTLMKKMILASTNVPRKKAKFENFLKTAFKFARPGDIDALWQQITRQEMDVENADPKDLSANGKEPPNGSNRTRQSEHLCKKSKVSTKNHSQPSTIQRSGDTDVCGQLEVYKRFGKIMMLHLKEHQNKMRIKRLRRMTLETFKQSKDFSERNHPDDFLEREFQRALNKRRRFTISDDRKKISISNSEV